MNKKAKRNILYSRIETEEMAMEQALKEIISAGMSEQDDYEQWKSEQDEAMGQEHMWRIGFQTTSGSY